MKKKPFVVLDTNVLVAALRSRRGASFKILSHLRQGNFDVALSVPLLFEYEDVLGRPGKVPVSNEVVDALLDYLCSVAKLQEIFFLWRPALKDLKDDMLLELSINAGCEAIVTHNVKDFAESGLDIGVMTPLEFLAYLEKQICLH